jgi:hypothetical protein
MRIDWRVPQGCRPRRRREPELWRKAVGSHECVISGNKRLQTHSPADRRFLRGGGLQELIVVIVGNPRDNETELLQLLAPTGEISCNPR